MKKKFLTLVLTGLMATALAACSGSSTPTESSEAGSTGSESATKANNANTSVVQVINEGKLIVATNAEFPPYEYHEGDKIVGIDMEIAEAIAKKMGLELEIEDIAFDSVILEVTSGKADMGMAGISATEERKQSVDFSDTYTTSKQLIIVKEDSEIAKSEDLEGKTIGVQTGTTGDLLVSDINDALRDRKSVV